LPIKLNKQGLLNLVILQLEADIVISAQAVEMARNTATHKDCLGSSKYETMGLEASYLAQGQGTRLLELERSLAYFKQLILQASDVIVVGSLVFLVDEAGNEKNFWLAADAGGMKVVYQQYTITIITPKSPMGKVMLGKEAGDDFTLKLMGKDQYFEVLRVI